MCTDDPGQSQRKLLFLVVNTVHDCTSHCLVKNCPIVFCRLALFSPLTLVGGLDCMEKLFKELKKKSCIP